MTNHSSDAAIYMWMMSQQCTSLSLGESRDVGMAAKEYARKCLLPPSRGIAHKLLCTGDVASMKQFHSCWAGAQKIEYTTTANTLGFVASSAFLPDWEQVKFSARLPRWLDVHPTATKVHRDAVALSITHHIMAKKGTKRTLQHAAIRY